MSRITRAFILTATAGMLLAFLSASGQAGGDKAPLWRHFLAPDDYRELTQRSLERMRTLAKDEGATRALRAEAVILAGYTISTKDAAALTGLRQKAIQVATLAANPDTAPDARKLAAALTAAKGDTKTTGPAIDWAMAIGDVVDLMTPLKNQAKGGEGIRADLHYTVKLKTQNGIEALLVALSAKQLTAANAGKMSKELELVGYRVATIGALTRRRGPHKNKEEAKEWDEQATVMRDAGAELAEAAGKKDAAGIFAASKRLMSSCIPCHASFK